MIKYQYVKFKEPPMLNEAIYYELRRRLADDPGYVIDPNPETFKGHNRNELMASSIGLSVSIIGLVVFDGDDLDIIREVFLFLSIICFFMTAGFLFNLYKEKRSFKIFVNKKRKYFDRMKDILNDTSSYHEFVMTFYNRRESSIMKNYYRILMIEGDSTPEEVKEAYKIWSQIMSS